MKRLLQSLRRRGLLGTAAVALQRLMPARCREAKSERAREAALRQFDVPNNIAADGIVELRDLQVLGSNAQQGTRYEGTLPTEFRQMMAAAGRVDHGRTFVDLGCGKGRALFLAAEYEFTQIVGVEFARELVEVARQNVVRCRGRSGVGARLCIVHGDAADYEFPAGPLVIFLYNPFGRTVMETVVQNVLRAIERESRAVTILYLQSLHADLWRRLPDVRHDTGYTLDGQFWSIFHSG